MRTSLWKSAAVIGALALAACSGGGDKDTTGAPDSVDARVEDEAVADLPQDLVPDLPAPDGVEPDQVVPDVAGDTADTVQEVTQDVPEGDTGPFDDFGFDIRIPQTHEITCSNYPDRFPEEPLVQADADWVCTFDYGDQHGHVYVQATPVDCTFAMMSVLPVFECPAGYMSQNGKVEKLLNPAYDNGGNHQNDFLEFDWQGKHFKVDHSTFGVGWHACRPMDCMLVYEGGNLLENGCVPKERSLPVVCVPVGVDGKFPPLVDEFEPCDGDDEWK